MKQLDYAAAEDFERETPARPVVPLHESWVEFATPGPVSSRIVPDAVVEGGIRRIFDPKKITLFRQPQFVNDASSAPPLNRTQDFMFPELEEEQYKFLKQQMIDLVGRQFDAGAAHYFEHTFLANAKKRDIGFFCSWLDTHSKSVRQLRSFFAATAVTKEWCYASWHAADQRFPSNNAKLNLAAGMCGSDNLRFFFSAMPQVISAPRVTECRGAFYGYTDDDDIGSKGTRHYRKNYLRGFTLTAEEEAQCADSQLSPADSLMLAHADRRLNALREIPTGHAAAPLLAATVEFHTKPGTEIEVGHPQEGWIFRETKRLYDECDYILRRSIPMPSEKGMRYFCLYVPDPRSDASRESLQQAKKRYYA